MTSPAQIKRVLCIVGMWDSIKLAPKVWGRYEQPFQEHFPGVDVVLEHETYHLFQRKKMKAYGERILQKYDDGIPTLLLGMSLGGTVATGIAQHFKKTPIIAVATLEAPLKLNRFWGYPYPNAEKLNLMTFAGLFDIFVPFPLTHVGQRRHRFLPADHLVAYLFSNKPSAKIVKQIREWLDEPVEIRKEKGA